MPVAGSLWYSCGSFEIAVAEAAVPELVLSILVLGACVSVATPRIVLSLQM